MHGKDFYTVREAVEILGMCRDSVYAYLRYGYIRSSRVGPHSSYRIPRSEIERFKNVEVSVNQRQQDNIFNTAKKFGKGINGRLEYCIKPNLGLLRQPIFYDIWLNREGEGDPEGQLLVFFSKDGKPSRIGVRERLDAPILWWDELEQEESGTPFQRELLRRVADTLRV